MDRSGTLRASTIAWRLRAPCLTPLALAMLGIASPCVRAQAVPGANGDVLPAVSVTATVSPDATTEGSGTYAAKRATIAGRTAERVKDIPRSVS